MTEDWENAKNLEEFFNKYKVIKYKKHEIILRAEEIPQGVYYVKKGYIRDYSISEQGEEFTFIVFKKGDIFPMGWVLNDDTFVHYLEAMTPAEIYRVPREKFIIFVKQNPEVLFFFAQRMLRRLSGLMDRMEHLVFGNAHQKLASVLMICAQRFGLKKGKNILIQLPLTHKDLGNLLGLTRETTSIEIKKLENEGVIEDKNKNITIKNLKKLKKESLQGHLR